MSHTMVMVVYLLLWVAYSVYSTRVLWSVQVREWRVIVLSSTTRTIIAKAHQLGSDSYAYKTSAYYRGEVAKPEGQRQLC